MALSFRIVPTDRQLLDAYHQAARAYGAAGFGTSDRPSLFVAFVAAERVLAARFGAEVYDWPYRARPR